MIERAKKYVASYLKDDASGHDYFHCFRVFELATTIAKEEGADVLMVQLASLLHDLDDDKISIATYENKDRARYFLKEEGFSLEEIEEIVQMMKDISFAGSGKTVPASLEGKCVQDADRLDAIGAIGIARAFAFGGSKKRLMYDPSLNPKQNMTKEEYQKRNGTTINHFYEKLLLLKDLMNTNTAKKMAEKRHQFMVNYLDEFYAEWNGEK